MLRMRHLLSCLNKAEEVIMITIDDDDDDGSDKNLLSSIVSMHVV